MKEINVEWTVVGAGQGCCGCQYHEVGGGVKLMLVSTLVKMATYVDCKPHENRKHPSPSDPYPSSPRILSIQILGCGLTGIAPTWSTTV